MVLLAGCTSRTGTALCKMHMKNLEISGQITDYAPKTTDYAKSVLERAIRDRIVYKKREALDSQCTFRMVHLALAKRRRNYAKHNFEGVGQTLLLALTATDRNGAGGGSPAYKTNYIAFFRRDSFGNR